MNRTAKGRRVRRTKAPLFVAQIPDPITAAALIELRDEVLSNRNGDWPARGRWHDLVDIAKRANRPIWMDLPIKSKEADP